MMEALCVIGVTLAVGIPLCVVFAIGVIFTKDTTLGE